MLKTIIPTARYDLITYPNLNSRSEGVPIPVAIGEIAKIVPVCIDTTTGKWKVAKHAIHAFTEIRSGAEALTLGVDYSVDLANAEFTIEKTPLVDANTLYYILFESDIAIDGSNYYGMERNLGVWYDKAMNPIANGDLFNIDAGDNWSDTGYGLYFEVYGKTDLTGNESRIISLYDNHYLSKSGHWTVHPFRDAAARTKLAQSFTTPATGGPWYVTKIKIGLGVHGSLDPARITTIKILDAAKNQIGCPSYRYEDAQGKGRFPIRAEVSDLQADIEGAEETGAMISSIAETVEYLIEDELGHSGILDAVYLAELEALRTHAVKLYLSRDSVTLAQILGKLESSGLWKFIPLLDGTYATVVYQAGEPANTLQFHDGDYLTFKMWTDYSAVRETVAVKYDQDAKTNEFKIAEAKSDIARFFYRNQEEMSVETYLAYSAGANWLRGKLGPMYETPPKMVEITVHGSGMDLIPGRDKMKLWKEHAPYINGELDGVLFRILKLQKHPGNSTVVLTGQLDSQTY